MQNLKEAFGSNLRSIRKNKKLTIEKLSEMLDITPRQLKKIESGDTFFTSETLCKISIALDVSLQTLFDISWQDNLMYFDNKKFIKVHFKATKCKDIITIKNLPVLKEKINQKITEAELISFLLDFAKNKKADIYVDFL